MTHVYLLPVLHAYAPLHACTCTDNYMGKHGCQFKVIMEAFIDTCTWLWNLSVHAKAMKQVCNTNGLLFPQRMVQNLLSLSQQTVHSSKVLSTNKQESQLWDIPDPVSPDSQIIQQPKTPEVAKWIWCFVYFKLLPTISSPAAFPHQTSLRLPLPFPYPVMWKQIGILASEQYYEDQNNLPLCRGQTGIVATIDPSFLTLCGSALCVCVCVFSWHSDVSHPGIMTPPLPLVWISSDTGKVIHW